MRKSYQMSEARRLRLAERHAGFRYREDPAYDDGSSGQAMVRYEPHGKPGLTVHHYTGEEDDNGNARAGRECPQKGIGCAEDYHKATYRDHNGNPIAFAKYTGYGSGGKPMVSGMYSDRSRGVAHALAVGHLAHHLDKVGVDPDTSLSAHSQRLVSHGFEHKEHGTDSRLKEYLNRRNARTGRSKVEQAGQQTLFGKGYKISDERMRALSQNYGGFTRRGIHSEANESAWRSNVNAHGRGRPGISITHQWGDACHKQGIGCDDPQHEIVHRDRAGSPVAYARISHPPDYARPYVSAMASDRTRGVAHALAVGHIANHIDKMGVDPDSTLTAHSQRLVSHGFELKETGRDSKLKDYLARRNARVQKGYQPSPESAQNARRHLGGAGPAGVANVDEFAHDELSRIPTGKPGLSIHRNTYAFGGGWHPARFEHEERAHTIVYRDPKGYPVTAASIYGKEHQWGKKDRRVTSTMVSDRSRGALHAIGTAHVANAVDRLHAGETKEMTNESQRMVAHSLDRPERTSKLRDYLARRSKRGN